MSAETTNPLREGLRRYLTDQQLQKLAAAKIGIAGAGGLGSNIAMLLARSGLENFILVDHDAIEASNLNRQHYWPGQLGQPKALALLDHLRALNPSIRATTHLIRLDQANISSLLGNAQIWIEALDNAGIKKIFVEQALLASHKVVAASGIAGYGGAQLRKRKMGNLVIVGDFKTDISAVPPLAPRVTQAAAMMADCVLEMILD